MFIFIGDSLTFGYGVHKNEGWVYKISKNTSLNVINKGINGDTTPSMLNRFFNDVISKNPDNIFIMGGTNDLLCGRSISSIIDNIDEMIKDSITIASNVYIGIPPCIISEMANRLFMPSNLYDYCEKNLPILRSKLITLCDSYYIKYIDFYSLSINNINNDIYLDGIHLNSFGNNLMFQETIKIIST